MGEQPKYDAVKAANEFIVAEVERRVQEFVKNYEQVYGKVVENRSDGVLVVQEAFVGPIFETAEGNRYRVCMRDNTIEIIVIGDAPMPRVFRMGVDLSTPDHLRVDPKDILPEDEESKKISYDSTFYGDLPDRLAQARNIFEIQGQNGNWDFDPYMHGFYNGIALLFSIFADEPVQYKDAPEKWLGDVDTEVDSSTRAIPLVWDVDTKGVIGKFEPETKTMIFFYRQAFNDLQSLLGEVVTLLDVKTIIIDEHGTKPMSSFIT